MSRPRLPSARTGRASDDRAQTVLDFAIGAGVFLLAVGVVFAFVPSLFEPFSGSATSAAIGADRSADYLTGQLLVADPAQPSILDAACTAAFFGGNDTLGTAADCGFNASQSSAALLGLGDRDVNVTVRVLDDSPTTGPAVPLSVEGTSYDLTRGEATTPFDVSVASRVVSIDGERYRLVVKVW